MSSTSNLRVPVQYVLLSTAGDGEGLSAKDVALCIVGGAVMDLMGSPVFGETVLGIS